MVEILIFSYKIISIGKLFEKTVRMYVSSIFRPFMNDEVSKVFLKN